MANYTYDPKLFLLTIGGRSIDSIQEGASISLEPNSDVSTTQSGVDNDFTRNVNTNISWTLTFTLNSGSANNDFLNTLIRSSAAVPFLLSDKNTGNTQASGTTYVQALPALMGGLESEGREYVFGAVDVNINYGGV
jgi:hypothetical protein